MKSDNKITLNAFRTRMQERMNYEDLDEAFDNGWYMWKHYCLRHNLHKKQFFSQTLKKGWFKRADADHFWWFLFKEEHY